MMKLDRVLRLGLWAQLLAEVVSQEQASLGAETTALQAEKMKLIAYKSKLLEAEWRAAQSSTEFPMRWIDDLTEKPCAGLPPNAYPSIKLLRGDQSPVDYFGPRTSDEILRFINRAKRSSEVPTKVLADEIESFESVDDFVCIGHLPSEAAIRTAFEAAAENYWTEFTFGVVDSPDATESKIVCHKRDDGSVHTWSSGDSLETWLLGASRPVIAQLTPSNHQRFLDRGWPVVYIFSPSPRTRADIRADLHAFARNHYSSLTAVTVDPTYFPDLPAKLGLSPSEDGYPAGAVHQLSNGRVYPYPKGKAFTPRELQGWGLDVWQGRIKPWTPPGQKQAEDVKGGNVRIMRSHNLKVKKIPGLKIKIGGRDRDEL